MLPDRKTASAEVKDVKRVEKTPGARSSDHPVVGNPSKAMEESFQLVRTQTMVKQAAHFKVSQDWYFFSLGIIKDEKLEKRLRDGPPADLLQGMKTFLKV